MLHRTPCVFWYSRLVLVIGDFIFKVAYAKTKNREIVNEILRHGKDIKAENVSVKGWQKRYGKAISAKSPSFVESELIRKAAKSAGRKIPSGELRAKLRGESTLSPRLRENAGGSVHKFSTSSTALSQTPQRW
ncbi:MAG: hypothetical protein PUP92_34150 [Rhizonema sp. PD38]|nr:hypothetical protein [Rhizonema sp. PD38]